MVLHVIASVEPILDLAIDRFLINPVHEFQVPARSMLLMEICELVARTLSADEHISEDEILFHRDLFEMLNPEKFQYLPTDKCIAAWLNSNLASHAARRASQEFICIAPLLQSWDKHEGTTFAAFYAAGIFKLLELVARIAGVAAADQEASVLQFLPIAKIEPATNHSSRTNSAAGSDMRSTDKLLGDLNQLAICCWMYRLDRCTGPYLTVWIYSIGTTPRICKPQKGTV